MSHTICVHVHRRKRDGDGAQIGATEQAYTSCLIVNVRGQASQSPKTLQFIWFYLHKFKCPWLTNYFKLLVKVCCTSLRCRSELTGTNSGYIYMYIWLASVKLRIWHLNESWFSYIYITVYTVGFGQLCEGVSGFLNISTTYFCTDSVTTTVKNVYWYLGFCLISASLSVWW